ncbi:MAG: hypothetical protein E7294_04090 [Lachnospiraceae bacterium]|jgi:uncharacterized repeat protein (TIGR02543 family)|nr:hypothetical protein [Lachnospiraceae bacterium]
MKRKELRKGFTGGLGRAVMMTVLTTALVFAGGLGLQKDSLAGRALDTVGLSGVTAQAKLTATSNGRFNNTTYYLNVDSLEATTDFDWNAIYEGEEVTDILSAPELNMQVKNGSSTYTAADAIIRSALTGETTTAAKGALTAYYEEHDGAANLTAVNVQEATAVEPYSVDWYECDTEGEEGTPINMEDAEFQAGKYYYCKVGINPGYVTATANGTSSLWIGRFTAGSSTLKVDGCEDDWACVSREAIYKNIDGKSTVVYYKGVFKSPYIQAKNLKELTYYDEEYNGYTNTWFAGAYVGDTVKRPTVTAKKNASATHITKVTTDIRYQGSNGIWYYVADGEKYEVGKKYRIEFRPTFERGYKLTETGSLLKFGIADNQNLEGIRYLSVCADDKQCYCYEFTPEEDPWKNAPLWGGSGTPYVELKDAFPSATTQTLLKGINGLLTQSGNTYQLVRSNVSKAKKLKFSTGSHSDAILTGFQYLTELEELEIYCDASSSTLETIDLSKNIRLKKLTVYNYAGNGSKIKLPKSVTSLTFHAAKNLTGTNLNNVIKDLSYLEKCNCYACTAMTGTIDFDNNLRMNYVSLWNSSGVEGAEIPYGTRGDVKVDMSGCTGLKRLKLGTIGVSDLNLNQCTALTELQAQGTKFNCQVDLVNLSALEKINLREARINQNVYGYGLSKLKDLKLGTAEVAAGKTVKFANCGLTSYVSSTKTDPGLNFKAMTLREGATLDLSGNKIAYASFDLTSTEQHINIGKNATLNLSGNSFSTFKSCAATGDEPYDLYLSDCKSLQSFDYGSAKFRSLYLNGCSKLVLMKGTVKANTDGTIVDCSDCALTALKLPAGTSDLTASNNKFTSLTLDSTVGLYEYADVDLSNNASLTSLAVSSLSLDKLDVSGSKQLSSVTVTNSAIVEGILNGCKLSTLDLTGWKETTYLDVSDNQLGALNIKGNTALLTLKAKNNKLTGIDLSANTKLTELDLSDNQLLSLSLDKQTALTSAKTTLSGQKRTLDGVNQGNVKVNLKANDASLVPSRVLNSAGNACDEMGTDGVLTLNKNTKSFAYQYQTKASNTSFSKLQVALTLNLSGGATVTFNANGGNVTPAYAIAGEGNKLDSLPTPVKEGSTFNGWYTAKTGGTKVTKDTTFTSDTIIYAQWTENPVITHALTFDMNGHGTAPAQQILAEGQKPARPADPANITDGDATYTFKGWCEDKACTKTFSFDKALEEDKTIYANWEVSYTYSIILYSVKVNDKTAGKVKFHDTAEYPVSCGTAYNKDTSVTITAIPEDGYRFVEWRKGSESGEAVSTEAAYQFKAAESTAFYAIFAENVTYNKGSYLLDLSKGPVAFTEENPFMHTMEAAVYGDESISMQESGEATLIDLNKDGVMDIQFVRNTADEWVYSGLEVAGNPDSFTITLSTAMKNAEESQGLPFYEKVTIQVKGKHVHVLKKEDREESSCYQKGHKEYWTCSDCGAYFADSEGKTEIALSETELPLAKHTEAEAVFENEKAAKCEQDGSYDEVVYCTVCGAELKRESKVRKAQGHKWGAWSVTKVESETEPGELTRVCANCGKVETKEIPVSGHIHHLEPVKEIPATETEEGMKAHYKCVDCGLLFEDAEGTKLILDESSLIIPKSHVHIAGAPVREKEVPATATEDGSYEEVTYCTICGVELSRTKHSIPKTGGGQEVPKTPPVTEPGAGTISGDGKTLTDTDGKVYRVAATIIPEDLKKGLTVADKKAGGKYRITQLVEKVGKDGSKKITGGTVEYVAPYHKDAKKIAATNAVKLAGVTFKVTSIAANCGKGCTKLAKVVIGPNVTQIGKNAFKGCKNLKSVQIKGKNLKKVGGGAFKGIHKKAVIKVPKAKLKAYQKLLKSKTNAKIK